MRKAITFILVCAAMLMAVSTQATDVKQAFRKPLVSAVKAIGKTGQLKGIRKKQTSQELKALRQNRKQTTAMCVNSNKKVLNSKKVDRRTPVRHRSFVPRRVEASDATPVTVPYEADFSVSGDAMDEDFIIINNNEDESDFEPCTWKWSAGNGAYYIYNEDGVTPADDYLVLPVNLKGGTTYDVVVNAATWNYPEEFEVVAGTECSAAGLTTTVIDKTTPENDAADYSGTFTPASDGVYYIAIHATSAADLYVLSIYRFSIDVAPDAAAPAAVSDLTVSQVPHELKNVIVFTAPTVTVGGDEMTENLSIDIQRDGETVKTFSDVAPGSERIYTDEVTAEATYRYQVIPSNAAGQGRKSEFVTVRVSMPQDVPYIVDFADENVFDFFQVIDNNEDGSTWDYSSYDEAARYNADWDNDADDYLVSQALRLQAGKKYDVTVRIAGNEYNTERFEVVAGTSATAEGLSIPVIEATEVMTGTSDEYTGSFTADADGFYYVAVHAISDASSYYLYVKGLNVEPGAEATAPAAPTLTATAAAEGAFSATVQVTAPDKTVDGNALSAITKLELYRDGTLVDERTDVAPGAVVTFTDEEIEASALYAYQAMAYNESGRGEKSEKTTVYVGLDQPIAPENVNAVDHPTSIDLSWDAVGSVGMNGGYVNPANVNYDIWRLELSPYFVFFEEKLASLTNQTSTTIEYAVDEGETQDFTYFAVRPTNESTENEDEADWNAVGVFTGKPYDAVVEGFADESLHYFWDTDALLAVTGYSSDEDGTALALLADTPGAKAFVSGKLNLKDATHPMLVFHALNAAGISQLYVMGSMDQGTWNILQAVTLSDEDYQTYQIPLNSLQNHQRYAQIAFLAEYKNAATEEDYGDFFFLDDIRIGDFLDNDLSVVAAAPAAVTAGKTAAIDVIVENAGLQPASNFSVKVMAGEKELFNETIADELAPFAMKQFSAQLATTVFDEAGDVNVTVSVDYAADQNTANNSISGAITIDEPAFNAPEDLVAKNHDGGGVELKWSAPESKTEEYTEDFENGTGEFTQIDGNDDGYGWVYIYDDIYDELKSHSGYGGMQSYSYISDVGGVQPDNWLVTPLAVLDGTFSFWAAAQDGDWTDEHFAVYVSTTGNQSVDDFVQVSEEFVSNGYPTEYTVDLSNYAGQEGYIAIRHYNSYDQFALVVDDISFIKAPSVPVAYNIYVEQKLVATVDGETTTYFVAPESIEPGEHNFAVTAVYAGEQESKPAIASIATGIKTLSDTLLKGGDIYNLAGQRVGKQLRGINIVGDRKVLVK